jgi:hypothetical protein
MPRAWVFLLPSLAALSVGACTFPSVDLEDLSSDTGAATSPVDSGKQDSAADTTVADTGATDTGASDTSATDTGATDTSTDTNDGCDKDGDGYKVATCTPPPAAGQADCDDNDKNVHPGVPDYVDSDPTLEPGPWSIVGDWNCNGVVEKRYSVVKVTCGGLSLGSCATKGFSGTGTCGEKGNEIICAVSGISCVQQSSTPAIQGCK